LIAGAVAVSITGAKIGELTKAAAEANNSDPQGDH
jgi:hypothetical protein